jgi:hypothetical protein
LPYQKKTKPPPEPKCERCQKPAPEGWEWWGHTLCAACGTEWTRRAPKQPTPAGLKQGDKAHNAPILAAAAAGEHDRLRKWTAQFIAEAKRGAA